MIILNYSDVWRFVNRVNQAQLQDVCSYVRRALPHSSDLSILFPTMANQIEHIEEKCNRSLWPVSLAGLNCHSPWSSWLPSPRSHSNSRMHIKRWKLWTCGCICYLNFFWPPPFPMDNLPLWPLHTDIHTLWTHLHYGSCNNIPPAVAISFPSMLKLIWDAWHSCILGAQL